MDSLITTGTIHGGKVTGNFKVSLPGTPKKMTRTLSTAVGKIQLHMFIVPTMNNKVAFAVMYNDYPAAVVKAGNADAILERAIQGAVRSKRGKITSKKNIKIDGHPGKSVVFEGMSGTKKLSGRIRIYLVGSRLYQLLLFQQEGTVVKQADVDKFHASFKRLKK